MLKIFNTMTRTKETFKPILDGQVQMYACGPTVYNFAHIGNLRTFVFEDFFRRTLEYAGFDVEHVMNITDIDDKTIKGANEKKLTLGEFTDRYSKAFFDDLKELNVRLAHHRPKATDYVDAMIAMIQDLLDKNIAYTDEKGNVFFNIKKFGAYGKLSHLKLEDLQSGASNRVDSDEYEKLGVGDFVLWKGYDKERDGQVYFDAPWSKGRPGWHIECSAMAKELLGESIDVHMGGVDNIFPHHENEIAQSECCSQKQFVKYWIHVEHLLVNGKKMSKSLGNFYTLKDLINKGYTARQVRFALLNAHYRTQLNFTLDGLIAAKSSLKRIDECVDRLKRIKNERSESNIDIDYFLNEFEKSLYDDVNAPEAFAALFSMINHLNSDLEKGALSIFNAQKALEALQKFDQVFGFVFAEKQSVDIPKEIYEALEARQMAREKKDFHTADKMRDMIDQAGFKIVDTQDGPVLKVK